jgi:hypothetical protein
MAVIEVECTFSRSAETVREAVPPCFDADLPSHGLLSRYSSIQSLVYRVVSTPVEALRYYCLNTLM